MPRFPSTALCLCAVMFLATPGHAADLGENVQVHGYGDLGHTWSNVDATDARRGAREVTYNVSLVGTWRLTERTSLWGQVFQSDDPARPRVDWAYVDHQAQNGLRWRAGQVRLPFGLHNEFRDVQALRPGAALPMLYEDELGIVDESFYGASVEAEHRLGAAGALSYEIYAAGALLPGGDRTAYGPALGARASWETPLDGLVFRWSGYAARLDADRTSTSRGKRANALSVRWQGGSWDAQAEVSRARRYGRGLSAHYVQGSWIPDGRWELVARIEQAATNTDLMPDDASVERQRVLGVAWRLNHNVGLRLEQHWHRGYGLAVTNEVVEAGEGRARWRSSTISVNYQF